MERLDCFSSSEVFGKMEKGKGSKNSSAISLQQFVSTMAPLIDMEKVLSLSPYLFSDFLHPRVTLFFPEINELPRVLGS